MSFKKSSLCLLLGLVVSFFAATTYGDYGSLRGNVPMDAPSDVYTVLVLPANWESDPVSQNLRNGFASDPQLKALRRSTTFVQYRSDDPHFQHLFAPLMPQAAAGQAAVLVVQGDQSLFCKYGDKTAKVSNGIKCGQLLDKLKNFRPKPGPSPGPCPGPNCPNPNPNPYNPNPNAYPQQLPAIPETPDDGGEEEVDEEEEDTEEEADMTIVLGTLAVAAAGVWIVSARARM